MLKKIRLNIFINRLIRFLLKKLNTSSNSIYSYIIDRWPTSGVVACEFNNIKFNMYNKCDDHIVNHFYYSTPYEEEADLRLFFNLAKTSKTIVDIGANTGIFSILASKASPNSTIYAIEPYEVNFERLKKNISLNSINNIIPLQVAIADKNSSLTFTIPKDKRISCVSSANENFSKKILPEIEWKQVEINAFTFDALAQNTINSKINLIKCDVESFEMNVFKGADNILKTHRPTIIFESFLDEERKQFFNGVLKTYNYYAYLILTEGIVYLESGFINKKGFNFLISPVKPADSFIYYETLFQCPEKVMLI